MPRRWRGFHRTPKPKVPKTPAAAKIAKPKVNQLRHIYKGLITADQGSRLAAMAYALQWFDTAIKYMLSANLFTPELQKKYAIAVKARNQGLGTNVNNEKEASFIAALRIYTKVCAPLHPPEFDKFYSEYEQKKSKLEAKQDQLTGKFGNVVAMLKQALNPFNGQGHPIEVVVSEIPTDVKFDPELSRMTYSKEKAAKLKDTFRREGLLALAVEQSKLMARFAATVPGDQPGTYGIDGNKYINAIHQLMDNLVKFCQTSNAPKRLAFPPKAAVQSVAHQPKVGTGAPSGVKRGPTHGPKIADYYVSGSAMAILYITLQDQQWHQVPDLQKLVTAEVTGRLKSLATKGKETGKWTLEFNGNQVKMNLAAPQATATAAAAAARP